MIWQYPSLDPVIFRVGPLTVHWYGFMYLLSFLLGWGILQSRRHHLRYCSTECLNDLLCYMMLGVVLGGRLGYMTFYQFSWWWQDPGFIFRLWEPGMSFHGGLLGVLLAVFLFARRYHYNFLTVTDFIAPVVPIGLLLGRLGNFINGELWGRPTHKDWGVIFRHVDAQPRHPTQLYEAFLEGFLLYGLLWVAWRFWSAQSGRVSGVFLVGYAVCRFGVEAYRQPDPQLGFVALHWMTMGQLLCIPMFFLGLLFVCRKNK